MRATIKVSCLALIIVHRIAQFRDGSARHSIALRQRSSLLAGAQRYSYHFLSQSRNMSGE